MVLEHTSQLAFVKGPLMQQRPLSLQSWMLSASRRCTTCPLARGRRAWLRGAAPTTRRSAALGLHCLPACGFRRHTSQPAACGGKACAGPSHDAAFSSNLRLLQAAEVLLASGCRVDGQDAHGCTPVHFAAGGCQPCRGRHLISDALGFIQASWCACYRAC